MSHSRYIGCLLMLALGAPFVRAADGDAEKGQATFQRTCVVCHYTDKTEKKLGPGLKGLYQNAALKNGKEVTDENVKAWIESGGNGMPPYKTLLSAADIDNLLAYLKTL